MKRPVVYAHRGASGYRMENTIPSFELAVAMKADAVEFDVQLTADGSVVVFHDFDLARLFNKDTAVSALTVSELAHYRLRDPADGKPVGIPLLPDLLGAIAHKIRMNIELKNDDNRGDRIAALCSSVYDRIREYGLMEEVIVSSFNIAAIRQMRSLSKDLQLAVLVDQLDDDSMPGPAGREGTLSSVLNIAHELSAAAINTSYGIADAGRVRRIHEGGFGINVYTVNNEELVKVLMEQGVDGFFTNYPDRMLAAVEHELRQNSTR